jgi:hypothetical protein
MKTSVQIPDEIYRQTKLLSDNFSFIVTQALGDPLFEGIIKGLVGAKPGLPERVIGL